MEDNNCARCHMEVTRRQEALFCDGPCGRWQELGLQSAYNNDPATNQYGKQILSLPYLPAELIPSMTVELRNEAVSDGQRRLMAYITQTWIESSLWPPSTWSVFHRCIRTNNDVEGWHRRLNAKANRGNLNMYLLMSLLAQEASLVATEIQMLRESAITRRQRNSKNTKRLFSAWDKLLTRERSPRQTLRAISFVTPMPTEAR